MNYEINVAKNGKHLFATNERSCTNIYETKDVLAEILKRFPKSEGFSIRCTYYSGKGYSIENLEEDLFKGDAIEKLEESSFKEDAIIEMLKQLRTK